MLRPVLNNFRNYYDLSGIWQFKVDKENIGENQSWFEGFISDFDIAVPGSWHEQLDDFGLLHYIGFAWYQKEFFAPSDLKSKSIRLRFNSVDYNCKVWLNSKLVGENNFGYLPFEFDVSEFLNLGSKNKLVLQVNNILTNETIPQGITSEEYLKENRLREETNPPARFDFVPAGGIHRSVALYTTPPTSITDVNIDTKVMKDGIGHLSINAKINGDNADELSIKISDKDYNEIKNVKIKNNSASTEFKITNCKFWDIGNPNLYDLNIKLLKGGETIDEYELTIGVRSVEIKNEKLLLNGKPVFLKGFGKHEDFPVFGKGFNYQVLIKDFSLLKWINANSFRTSHYPYAEEVLDLADQQGFLVIDEVPAVSLDLRRTNQKTIENHKSFVKKLIERDGNHPCVIAWAIGNEPNLVGAKEYYDGVGDKYWKEIFSYTRSLDNSRPITVPNCQRAGTNDPVFKYSDILSINRYYGWYENPGDLEKAIDNLNNEMEELWNKYSKPVMVTEFGADTIAGFHSTSYQMFTEEYQSELIESYIKLIESKNYTVGEHVWNFADFRTPQHFRRVVNNLKGVFNRIREPKKAAFTLKKLWGTK
jgi:beta-glucuronidase